MMSREAQQQLTFYFNELLTELDGDLSTDSRAESIKYPWIPTINTDAQRTGTNEDTKQSIITSVLQKKQVNSYLNNSYQDEVLQIQEKSQQQQQLEQLLKNLSPTVSQYLTDLLPTIQKQTTTENFSSDGQTTKIINLEEEQQTEPNHRLTYFPWTPIEEEWLDNGRPSWAQTTFEVLLVQLKNISDGLPLGCLDAICSIQTHLTPLFGQARWLLGLHKTYMGQIKLINTTQLIMPERYDPTDKITFEYDVVINGSGWGLGVDNIDQPVCIHPDEIQWSHKHISRHWVAGIIKEYMCILIDIPVLASMLRQTDKNNSIFS